jgi:hypothetical protein
VRDGLCFGHEGEKYWWLILWGGVDYVNEEKEIGTDAVSKASVPGSW